MRLPGQTQTVIPREVFVEIRPLVMYTVLYMSSIRTQIYLTEGQRRGVERIRQQRHCSLAEVIRMAVDEHIENSSPEIEPVLAKSFGSMPNLEGPSRDEWNRNYG